MDIRSTALDGVGEDQVDQLDDRGVFTGLFQRTDIHVVRFVHHLEIDIFQIAHDVGQRGALVVVLVDGILDGGLGSNHHLDVVPRHELDVVDREDVRGIAHGDDQGGAGAVDGNNLVFLGNFGGNQPNNGLIDIEFGEVDRGHAVLPGEKGREFFLLEETELDQAGAKPAPLNLLFLECLGQLFVVNELIANEKFAESVAGHEKKDLLRQKSRQYDKPSLTMSS